MVLEVTAIYCEHIHSTHFLLIAELLPGFGTCAVRVENLKPTVQCVYWDVADTKLDGHN